MEEKDIFWEYILNHQNVVFYTKTNLKFKYTVDKNIITIFRFYDGIYRKIKQNIHKNNIIKLSEEYLQGEQYLNKRIRGSSYCLAIHLKYLKKTCNNT